MFTRVRASRAATWRSMFTRVRASPAWAAPRPGQLAAVGHRNLQIKDELRKLGPLIDLEAIRESQGMQIA
jgi:hypothetical protein